MGLTFKGGGVGRLQTALKLQQTVMRNEVEQIMEQTMEEAVELQRDLLDKAETEWGRYRMSKGRGQSAGRRDTDLMYGGITYDVESERTKITGRWGWLWHIEKYFAAQDWGTSKIGAAHSLLDSYVQIRERFIQRIMGLVK